MHTSGGVAEGAAAASGEGPYKIQYELQDTMQTLVGIVRNEGEMKQALEAIRKYKARAEKVAVVGNREYNAGWHTALDLQNLLTVSEAITKAGLQRKESRGGHFRNIFCGGSTHWWSLDYECLVEVVFLHQYPLRRPLNDRPSPIFQSNTTSQRRHNF